MMFFLMDAKERPVLLVNGDFIQVASPLARELLRLAPEMAALIEELEYTSFDGIVACPVCNGARHNLGCRLAAILAALDAARKDGT